MALHMLFKGHPPPACGRGRPPRWSRGRAAPQSDPHPDAHTMGCQSHQGPVVLSY